MTERLARILPDEMTPEQKEIYEKFVSGKRAAPGAAFSLAHPEGGLTGPPNAWLLSPPLAKVFEQLGGTIRYGLELSERACEIAILLQAFHLDSPFELYAHRRAGRAAGLSDAEIEGLATRTPPALGTDEERHAFDVTLAILDHRTLSDDEYRTAVAGLGERKLFELVALLGHYYMVALQLAVFDVQPPE